MAKAYFIGRIYRDPVNYTYVLKSVFIASCERTSVGERFVELHPPMEGASFHEASKKAKAYWDYGPAQNVYRGLPREWRDE